MRPGSFPPPPPFASRHVIVCTLPCTAIETFSAHRRCPFCAAAFSALDAARTVLSASTMSRPGLRVLPVVGHVTRSHTLSVPGDFDLSPRAAPCADTRPSRRAWWCHFSAPSFARTRLHTRTPHPSASWLKSAHVLVAHPPRFLRHSRVQFHLDCLLPHRSFRVRLSVCIADVSNARQDVVCMGMGTPGTSAAAGSLRLRSACAARG
ncbi:hypothetical protein C8R47DRAFT_79366 [Mycena vitilis]|nr:hypothetical protein C8R47DRAFT_79366 [Mycena vitilis]